MAPLKVLNSAEDSVLYCRQVAPVFIEYEEKLRSFIRKRVPDEEDQKDLLQEVLLKLYNHCEKLPKVKNMQAWLYQVTRNTLTDYYKEAARFAKASSEAPAATGLAEEEFMEIQEYIRPMISLLPEKYAKPLIMSDLEGVPQQEIARYLGISLSGAKSRVQRAREKLRELMMECFIQETSRNGAPFHFELKRTCGCLLQVKKDLENQLEN